MKRDMAHPERTKRIALRSILARKSSGEGLPKLSTILVSTKLKLPAHSLFLSIVCLFSPRAAPLRVIPEMLFRNCWNVQRSFNHQSFHSMPEGSFFPSFFLSVLTLGRGRLEDLREQFNRLRMSSQRTYQQRSFFLSDQRRVKWQSKGSMVTIINILMRHHVFNVMRQEYQKQLQ